MTKPSELLRTGRFAEYIAHCKSTVNSIIARQSQPHAGLAIACNRLASALYVNEQFEESLQYRTLAIDNMTTTLGKDNIQYVHAMLGLGQVNNVLNHRDDAERAYREAHSRSQVLQSPSVVLFAATKLAGVLSQYGEWNEAEELFSSVRKTANGHTPAKLRAAYHMHIGRHYARLNKNDLARASYASAQQIFESAEERTSEYADCLVAIASTRASPDLTLLSRALGVLSGCLPPAHPKLVRLATLGGDVNGETTPFKPPKVDEFVPETPERDAATLDGVANQTKGGLTQ